MSHGVGTSVVGVFEVLESDHQSCGQAGCAVVFAVEGGVGFVESFPLDRGGEVDEGVMGTDNVVKSCLEELNGARLVLGGFSGLHFESKLQPFGKKTPCF